MILPRPLTGFAMLVFFINLSLIKFYVGYLILFRPSAVLDSFDWFAIKSLHNNFFYWDSLHARLNWPIKQNQLSFPSIEINKPLLTPVHSVLLIKFKFRSHFKLLPHIRCLITIKIESSMISIDSNITDNIIRKAINV